MANEVVCSPPRVIILQRCVYIAVIVTIFNECAMFECPIRRKCYRPKNIQCDDHCTQECTPYLLGRRDCAVRLINLLIQSGSVIDIHIVHRVIATMPVYKPADKNMKRDVQEKKMISPCNKASRKIWFRSVSSLDRCLQRVCKWVSIVEIVIWARRRAHCFIYIPFCCARLVWPKDKKGLNDQFHCHWDK